MNFVSIHKLPGYELYSYYDASNGTMCILGSFFSDIGDRPDIILFFQLWPFDNSQSDTISTNATCLEKDNNLIYLKSSIPRDNDDDNDDTTLVITSQQFSQLMHNWQEKVCQQKPKKVTVIYENDEFTIQTKD